MKHQKDISDLFKENEHKLSERPSLKTWRRLENRLDQRKQKHRKGLYRQLMAAAAVFLLLLVSSAVLMTQKQNAKFVAANSPTALEDLSNYASNESEMGTHKVMEFTRKHVSRLANPVEEGDKDKKLVPNKAQ